MPELDTPLFRLLTGDELREQGYDPANIWTLEDQGDNSDLGPYRPLFSKDIMCGCCSALTAGWTVINLNTGNQISDEWTHDEAKEAAEEKARDLNWVWMEGYRVAREKDAPDA